MNNIIEKCKTTRILGTIGIIGLVLGTILPYAQYNIFGYRYSVSLWGYWEGKVVMILAIANLLFIFKDIVEKYIPGLFNTKIGMIIRDCNNQKFSLIPTVLSVIFIIFLTVSLGIKSFKYYSIGFYLVLLGIISLVAYAFLHKKDDETIGM